MPGGCPITRALALSLDSVSWTSERVVQLRTGSSISYKMSWEGLPVVPVSPRGTSSKCSVCEDQLAFSKDSRTLHCPRCNVHIKRDVNTARNILNAGLRFSLVGPSGKTVKRNPTGRQSPESMTASQAQEYCAEQPKT